MAKTADYNGITPDKRNANKGTERGRGMVEASLRETGAGRSILLDNADRIIAGNKTFEAASDIGLPVRIVETDGTELIAVKRTDLDLSDDSGMARKMAYYDNRSGQVGLEWDAEVILSDLQAGVDLSALFRNDELDELLAGLTPQGDVDAEPQIDKAEELRVKWGVESGQMWQLGDHKLVCGDCTDAAVVARVMQGERAALGVTSPPYGVGKDYESGGLDSWKQTVSGMLSCAATITDAMAINLGDVKVGPNSREVHSYGLLVELCNAAGLPLIGTRIWVKGAAWAGQGPYWLTGYRSVDEFEYIGIFGELQHKDRTDADWRYRGVWDIASVTSNKLHSAMFPIELPQRLIELLCDAGASVYEPFSGSGTVIVACENLRRKCRAVEISPGYVAVALQRYYDATQVTPVLLDATTNRAHGDGAQG